MLSGILTSDRTVEVNIQIMRAFVKLREMIASNKSLSRRLDDLEKKYDAQFKVVFEALRQLMTLPANSKRKITRLSPDSMSRFDLKGKQTRYGKNGSKK